MSIISITGTKVGQFHRLESSLDIDKSVCNRALINIYNYPNPLKLLRQLRLLEYLQAELYTFKTLFKKKLPSSLDMLEVENNCYELKINY
jgi:hypothetical protein